MMVCPRYLRRFYSSPSHFIRRISKSFQCFTIASILTVGMIFVYIQSSAPKTDIKEQKEDYPFVSDETITRLDKGNYTPSGLIKLLDPEKKWIRYQPISFDDQFRYPAEVDMVELTENLLKGRKSNVHPTNEHPFRYLNNPEKLCSTESNNSDIDLLILVKSSTQYYTLRRVIRKTWGKDLKKRGKYKLAFLLGQSKNYQQHYINLEHKENHDIIQQDFIDNYVNNTYKTVMAYNWASQYCSNARTVLFLDDDMFLNSVKLEKHISEFVDDSNHVLFTGRLAGRSKPIRNQKSKWFMPWHEYPYDFYPKYLAGSAIFASMHVVKRFHAAFPYIRHFGVDDVYLGIVAHKLNITPTKALYIDNDNLRNFKKLPHLIANHGFRDFKLYHRTYLNLTSFRRRTACTFRESTHLEL